MPFRVLFGLGVPAAALAGLWFLYRFGNPFPCVFHKLTGLYCPGCGAGRALSALLHLHLVDAIDYNVFFVMALPLAAYYLLKKYICPGLSPRSAADIQHLPAHLQYRDAGDSRLLDSAQHPRVPLYAVGPMRVDID